jgi:hypothetical protein
LPTETHTQHHTQSGQHSIGFQKLPKPKAFSIELFTHLFGLL